MKLPERVDRRAFWAWAIPLVIGHAVLSGAASAGVNGMGAIDTLLVVMLAGLVARRFRDIGWRGWIGGSFVIATMLVVPLMVVAYAIANHLQPAQFTEAMNKVGMVIGSANLVLLAVAGYVKGGRLAEPSPANPVVETLRPPTEANSPTVAAGERRAPNVFALSVIIVLVVVMAGISISWLIPRPYAASTRSASSQVSIQGLHTQSNGLTKDTNDFLRGLLQQSPAPPRH